MRRRLIGLIFTVVAIAGIFVGTLVSSSRPVLGLDLQGGISIVLFPVKGSDLSALNTAVDVIRNRIDGLGIAEPDVQRQGGTIVVNLPGVKDRSKAESLVGETAELRFRPVQYSGDSPLQFPFGTTSTTTKKGAATTTSKGATSTTGTGATSTTGAKVGSPSASSTSAPKSSTTGHAAGSRTISTDPIVARFAVAASSGSGSVPTTAAGITPTTIPKATTTTVPAAFPGCAELIKKSPKDTDAAEEVVLPDRTGTSCYVLGPAVVTGKSIGSASTLYDSTAGQWSTNVHFKNNDFLTKIAGPYVNKEVAIELDGVVQSAPVINPGITGRDVEITGNFTQGQAKQLSLVLRYGALPVQFDPQKQTVESVSPTLGRDQLTAGIVSGLIGLALVALYMLLFYRLLGLVVIVGLGLTGMLFFGAVSYLSSAHGLTLSLAGVTGIIVSVGVTVDSYVVYFERLKDEVRTGKTVRSSLEPGFVRSWRTIVAADLVSLIGAGVLYVFATSSVRGFAFFLGLSTAMDLLLAYFFMHPMVSLLSRRPSLVQMPGIGIASRARRPRSDGMTATTTPRPTPAVTEDVPGVDRRHRPSDFYHERTNFQFIKHTRRWAILSGTLILLSFVALFARGLNFGIDFEGGTSWQVQMAHGRTAHVADVRDVLRPLGFSDATVSILSGASGHSVNVQAHLVTDPIKVIDDALATYGGVTEADVLFQPAKTGGTFTFTTSSKVKPTSAGIDAALAKTELRGQTEKISGRDVTVTAKALPLSPTERVADALAKFAGTNSQAVSISTVGPTWGHTVSRKAEQALVYFFILLALYLSIRFEAKMSAAAIIAVIHDIIFTVGVYALFHFEVTPATITAFLTILGFSLYDTVVVFDKVRENQRVLTATGRTTYSEMVNKSLNAVLMRSLSTSFVALMPVLSLLIVGAGVFGATSLEDFALALAAGLFIGSYSSIFVVAPILAWWKEREPQYRSLAERRRRVGVSAPAAPVPATAPAARSAAPAESPALATVGVPGESAPVDEVAQRGLGVAGPPAVGRTIQPRARQQRRRKRK